MSFKQSSHPLVTVVIPTYNRPDLVLRAVESVLNQSYPNIEIIVVDDASDQNAESLLKKFDKVKYFKNRTNKGPCFSRNVGLKEASGEYINFLDDDDLIFETKIEKQIALFRNTSDEKLGMVTSHAIDKRSGKTYKKLNKVKGDIYQKLLRSYTVSGTETMLFKISYLKEIGGFDEKLLSSQEYDLLIRFCHRYTVDYVDEILSEENRSYGQISVNFEKKIKGARRLYKKHSWRFKEESILFWMIMQIKLYLLLFRFYAGKILGEKAYRILLFEGRKNSEIEIKR